MSSNLPTEHQEQVELVKWFQGAYPEIKTRLFAIPNGTNKSVRQAAWYMAEGLRSGVPDMMLPIPKNGFHGLFIELKRQKGGVLSKTQKDWHEYLNAACYLAVVCHGAEEAKTAINSYLKK